MAAHYNFACLYLRCLSIWIALEPEYTDLELRFPDTIWAFENCTTRCAPRDKLTSRAHESQNKHMLVSQIPNVLTAGKCGTIQHTARLLFFRLGTLRSPYENSCGISSYQPPMPRLTAIRVQPTILRISPINKGQNQLNMVATAPMYSVRLSH